MINKNTSKAKRRALERESNITLVSTIVIICSFFILLYIQNLLSVNFTRAQSILTVIEVLFAGIGIATAVVAIVRKQKYLFEYTVFFLVTALGYYLLKNGASGIPGLVSEKAGVITISPMAETVGKILQSKYIILSLWGVNVIYAIFTITLHTVNYSKIKKSDKKQFIVEDNQ